MSVPHSSCTIQMLCCPPVPQCALSWLIARIGVPCFTQQGRLLCGRAANRWLLPRPPRTFVM